MHSFLILKQNLEIKILLVQLGLFTPYHYKGLEGETTADLAKAVNAKIGRGSHVHPDSDEELQAATPLPTRGKRTIV